MSGSALKSVALDAIDGHPNLLQTGFWGRLKSGFGWDALAFEADGRPLLVLIRNLGAGRFLAYIPHGPLQSGCTAEANGADFSSQWQEAAALASELKKHLPSGCMFVRFDPPWGVMVPSLEGKDAGFDPSRLEPSAEGFRKSAMDIQPASTVVLDLTQGEEGLLAGMKSKTRYNIRLAAKKGVEVVYGGPEDLPVWYSIYKETAERDRIALHGYDYYETFFRMASESSTGPDLHLLLARIDGNAEAGIVVCHQGPPGQRKATYLYGASSNNKRNCMPAYALQWAAIKAAAEAGCTSYDLFGIPPADDPSHPMHGLYRFKTGFGGDILHRPGSWDFPLRHFEYGAFRSAERMRNFYYKRLRKIGR